MQKKYTRCIRKNLKNKHSTDRLNAGGRTWKTPRKVQNAYWMNKKVLQNTQLITHTKKKAEKKQWKAHGWKKKQGRTLKTNKNTQTFWEDVDFTFVGTVLNVFQSSA